MRDRKKNVVIVGLTIPGVFIDFIVISGGGGGGEGGGAIVPIKLVVVVDQSGRFLLCVESADHPNLPIHAFPVFVSKSKAVIRMTINPAAAAAYVYKSLNYTNGKAKILQTVRYVLDLEREHLGETFCVQKNDGKVRVLL